jgi:CRP-like cAMP-binding protein
MTDAASPSADSLGLVERVAALHRVRMFAAVPGRVLAAVAETAVEQRVARGEVLMEEGSVEAHLYALVEGRVRVHRGARTIVELGPGATVGELAALVPAPRTASVTALEPTLVLRVDQMALDELLVEWPELAHGVIAELVSRVREVTAPTEQAP